MVDGADTTQKRTFVNCTLEPRLISLGALSNYMPIPDDVPGGNCTFCDGPITEIQRVSHWSNADHSGGFGYSGICRKCDVDYTILYHDRTYQGWHPVAPDASELTGLTEEAELEAVTRKLQRYPAHHSQWQAFLNRRRKGG